MKRKNILPASLANIRRGADILRKGGLVAFPTETVYGLGAGVFLPQAVARIFEVKGRPRFDPLIVHVASLEEVYTLWQSINPRVEKLIHTFWPGPLTIVFPKRETVPDIVTAGLSTVAVRMPAHQVALSLIREAGFPIAAPSANRFGHVSPTRAEEVASDLGDRVELILDGGKCERGVESTVLLGEGERLVLLRPGAISVEELEEVVGKIETVLPSSSILAPGMVKKHYAPSLPLYLFLGEVSDLFRCELGNWVVLSPFSLSLPGKSVVVLSEDNNLEEVASNLFGVLRELERSAFEGIIALPVKEEGLGRTIMDRLKRASSGIAEIKENRLILIDK